MQYSLSSSLSASSSSSSSFAAFAVSASAEGVPPGLTDAERDPEADPVVFLPPLVAFRVDGGVALPDAVIEFVSAATFLDLEAVLALGLVAPPAVLDFELEA